MSTLTKKAIHLAYRKPNLRGHLLPLIKKAADLASTPEGAKKMFQAYKEKHPATKKQPRDFLDPNAGKGKDKISDKKVKEVNKELGKERDAAVKKAGDVKVPEKVVGPVEEAMGAVGKFSTAVGTAAGASLGGMIGVKVGGTAGLVAASAIGLSAGAAPVIAMALGALAGALLVGYLGAKASNALGKNVGEPFGKATGRLVDRLFNTTGNKKKASSYDQKVLNQAIASRMHNLTAEDLETLKASMKDGKLDKKKLKELSEERVKAFTK